MSGDLVPVEQSESKPSKKAVKKADPGPLCRIGDTVIYTPSITQANALRSVRGLRDPKFPAIVTFVRPDDGMCHLTVFPAHGLHQFQVIQCFEGEGPNTFARRDP